MGRSAVLRAAAAAAVLAAAAAFVRVEQAAGAVSAGREGPLVVAHRAGAALGPENSLSALEASIAAGADMAEVDVRLSRDGVPVLCHDETLETASGADRRVGELSLRELSQLDRPVPTLEEVLRSAKGRIPLMLELKPGDREELLCRRVVSMVAAHGMEGECVVASSSVLMLEACGRLAPALERVYVSRLLYPGLEHMVHAQGYSIDRRWAGAAAAVQAHGEGRALYIWTVNTLTQLRTALSLGPDGIITDDPALALELLGRGGEDGGCG